jgi:hypothetical protein
MLTGVASIAQMDTLEKPTHAPRSLNVTANTIMSNYNNVSVMTTRGRMGTSQVELCPKLDHAQIQLGAMIMEGTYSCIYEARLLKPSSSNHIDGEETREEEEEVEKSVRVMVKTVNEYASKEQADKMVIEAAMLRGIKHKNVNAIVGVCFDKAEKMPMAVFGYFEMGNLKNYLVRTRTTHKTNSNSVDLNEQVRGRRL